MQRGGLGRAGGWEGVCLVEAQLSWIWRGVKNQKTPRSERGGSGWSLTWGLGSRGRNAR